MTAKMSQSFKELKRFDIFNICNVVRNKCALTNENEGK